MGGQMNCEEYKKLVSVQIYGQLSETEENDLHRHINDCTDCAAKFQQAGKYHDLIIDQEKAIPEPDWEASWQSISARLPGTKGKFISFTPLKRWALAASVIVTVFVGGYVAGRKLLQNPGKTNPVAFAKNASQASQSQWHQYADRLGPLLTGFTNSRRIGQPEELNLLEKKIIREMLIQTRLLKTMTRQNSMTRLQLLLEDLEFILTSMSNLRPQDRHTATYLGKIIKEKEIKFKLRALMKDEGTI